MAGKRCLKYSISVTGGERVNLPWLGLVCIFSCTTWLKLNLIQCFSFLIWALLNAQFLAACCTWPSLWF